MRGKVVVLERRWSMQSRLQMRVQEHWKGLALSRVLRLCIALLRSQMRVKIGEN